MDRFRSTSGFTSETSPTPSTRPHTPPYTPIAKGRRPLARSESPAASIHPAETSSPAKKEAKRTVGSDEVKVEELPDDDDADLVGVDVVYPESLEEVHSSSDGGDELSSSDVDGPETEVIARQLSKLRWRDESAEVEFEKGRRQRHWRKRRESRLFKRSHSQSAKSEVDLTDADAMGDQDVEGSHRRLRRRVHGPAEDDLPDEQSPLHRAHAESEYPTPDEASRPNLTKTGWARKWSSSDDVIDIDDLR